MTPLITIGITCYNAEDTIARAIDSALAQDWPNFEIVIIDDHSTDSSVSVILAYTEQYKDKIQLFKSFCNSGVASSRNKVLEKAKGEYIIFFDDDDVSLPHRIRTQYQKILDYQLQTGAPIICCHASICKKYPNGYEVHMPAIGSHPNIPVGEDVIAYQLFLARNPRIFYGSGTPSCSFMAKTESLRNAGGYDITLKRNEDTELSIRLGLMGAHFIGCPEELVIQYASDGKDKRPEVGYRSEMAIVEKYRTYLEQHKKYYFARGWVKIRYYHYSNQIGAGLIELFKLLSRYPLQTMQRLLYAAPRRLMHERKMTRKILS